MSDTEMLGEEPPLKKLDKGKGKVVDRNGSVDTSEDSNLPWVEKYRPKDMDDVVSHQDIISTSTAHNDPLRSPD